MQYLKIVATFLLLACSYWSCRKNSDQGPDKTPEFEITKHEIVLNPNGIAPLSANITLTTSFPTKVSLRVVGKNGPSSDVVRDFGDVNSLHTIPVLGLYPGYQNIVELSFKDASGAEVSRKKDTIITDQLPGNTYPDITINNKNESQMAPGMTLVSYFGYNGDNPTPQTPFIFDAFGDIRWYLDFRSDPVLNKLYYDCGLERLRNGNFYFGDGSTGAIYEVDMLGKIINTWPFPGYLFHHNVQEKPDGNFLVTVTKEGSPTIEDFIIEIDRNTKQIIRTWDLNLSLQYSRQTLSPNPVDWIHVNAVIYDESDSCIILSGRTQGIVKLDRDNNVVWIMGCHKGWDLNGRGEDLKNFLLQPLDKNNLPITDTSVIQGYTNHPDFEWNWYQHAPLLMPDGHLMLFDNGGESRNFMPGPSYSRAAEYEINKNDKTIKQIWEYGKERGTELYSMVVSDVDYLSTLNHVIFSPGAINNTTFYGKVVEVDYTSQEIIFEATITAPKVNLVTFHRTERLSLYP